MCIKGNDWICTGSTDSTIYIWPNPISSCLKQVSLRTITSTPPPSISLPPTHLPQTVLTSSTLKIVIGVLSALIIVIVAFLVYKWCKRLIRQRMENIKLKEPLDDNFDNNVINFKNSQFLMYSNILYR